jgi:hypothetical protein
MIGNQEKSSGTAGQGSGRNYNPNAKHTEEDLESNTPSDKHPEAAWAPKDTSVADGNKLISVRSLH